VAKCGVGFGVDLGDFLPLHARGSPNSTAVFCTTPWTCAATFGLVLGEEGADDR
jgi:hypothetical protein